VIKRNKKKRQRRAEAPPAGSTGFSEPPAPPPGPARGAPGGGGPRVRRISGRAPSLRPLLRIDQRNGWGYDKKMRILEIKDIVRKDVPIYYRRLFSGIAVLELVKDPADYPIDFSIENKPTGEKEILITFAENPDYPLVPLMRDLKKFIDKLDMSGGLPG
jgi:hypothetical protein